jgi:PAS domain S-box-containing protein
MSILPPRLTPAEHESARLAALDRYRILDTKPEREFDDIVRIAAEICAVPMALISLVDDKRQWFKAALGLGAAETPREIAFCAHAIQQSEIMMVPDAQADARFADNPLVTGDPNLRFYAGAPLLTPDGLAIGTLCVLDREPRSLTEPQRAALEALGRQVMTQLELRQALAARRAEEERNRLILDNALDQAIISIDRQGVVTSWNAGAQALFGWTSAEMRGRLTDELFVPEDRGQGMQQRDRALALAVGRSSVERWHVRKDGQRFFAGVEVMPLNDGHGAALGFLIVVRDQTELLRTARMQSAVLELNDRLRDSGSTAEMAVIAAEILGRTLQVGRAGYGTVDSDGQTFVVERDWVTAGVQSIAGRHAMAAYGFYHEELQRGLTVAVHDSEADPRTMDGALGDLHTRAIINFPLVEDGRLAAVFFVNSAAPRRWDAADLAFVRDVAERTRHASARRRAETELRELAASLEAQVDARLDERNRLWSSTNELMATAGSDGYLKEINPAWTRLLGWDESTLLARPFIDLVDPADYAALRAVMDKLQRGETVLEFTNTVRASDGSSRVVTWSAVPERDVFYIVGRDVSVQRDMEERLRQSQKMEAIGQLTGGIAHDFNNLLAGILGSVALIRLRCNSGRYDALDRLLDAAEKSAKSAASLTARLLAFSRRQSLDVKASDVNSLVAGMGDLLHRTLGETVELRTVLLGGLWPALTDDNQLENAILNLAINARDAMPKGGRLTIETANASVGPGMTPDPELAHGDYVIVSVSDTGTGMSADVAARAFDPFFTTKPMGQGTGLGLSMIYGFAKQSAGHATIRSELGRGTTIELYLPRGTPGVEQAAAPAAGLPQGEGEKLLLVEDDDTLRSLVVEALQDLGYEILEADHPKAALQILDSGVKLQLLLTDVGLPYMNGRQLAEIAREKRPQLKVLFLTGYAENAAARGGFLGDGMQMLTKPFTLEALAGKVQEMLRA